VATESGVHHNFGWLLGSTISVGIAALLTLLVRGSHRSVIVPIVFIVVIILCARYFGAIAGILGSVIATSLFALFLFEPYGSFRVDNRQALSNLALLLFAGIALSYANSERQDVKPPRGH
jgi:K+-sensing histidine kinase KdpD